MTADSASINLTHHFLIAMPGLEDAAFAKSVVYVCEHSERGALGLVINKPSDLSMQSLFEKVDLSLHREDLMNAPVLQGGPVHTERGFVLHDAMVIPRTQDPAPAESGIQLNAAEQEAKDEAQALSEVSEGSSASDNESVYASTMTIPGGLEMTTPKMCSKPCRLAPAPNVC